MSWAVQFRLAQPPRSSDYKHARPGCRPPVVGREAVGRRDSSATAPEQLRVAPLAKPTKEQDMNSISTETVRQIWNDQDEQFFPITAAELHHPRRGRQLHADTPGARMTAPDRGDLRIFPRSPNLIKP